MVVYTFVTVLFSMRFRRGHAALAPMIEIHQCSDYTVPKLCLEKSTRINLREATQRSVPTGGRLSSDKILPLAVVTDLGPEVFFKSIW